MESKVFNVLLCDALSCNLLWNLLLILKIFLYKSYINGYLVNIDGFGFGTWHLQELRFGLAGL